MPESSNPSAPIPFRTRRLHGSDIGFALTQTARQGWDSTWQSFNVHLKHDPLGCFVAEIDGEPVGLVTTTRYRETAWIGNLLVDSASRGSGIGSQLMERAVRHLEHEGATTIHLEADSPGINIYRRLGFEERFQSPRFRLTRIPSVSAPRTSAIHLDQLGALEAFDAPFFGDRRGRMLRHLHGIALATHRMPERGSLAGYLMVLPSHSGVRLGPWVASDARTAFDLLRAALSSIEAKSIIVALPGPNEDGLALLRAAGFEPAPSCTRMSRGPRTSEGRPGNIFGLASGAIG